SENPIQRLTQTTSISQIYLSKMHFRYFFIACILLSIASAVPIPTVIGSDDFQGFPEIFQRIGNFLGI
ncbi:hypothetical protein BGZ81_011784, partial [Podila clonocystis]